MPIVTSIYAGALGVVALGIAFAAGSLRGRLNISVGDGGNSQLLCAMRRHANFVEWVPLALILIALLELDGASKTLIHALGIVLVISRILHAVGIRAETMKSVPRLVGATGTALVTLTASVWLIVTYLLH